MVLANPFQERRQLSRVSADGFEVDIRPQGRLARVRAEAVDFNRHGIAVVTESPLKERKSVYVTLRVGDLRLENLAGIVHNCCQHGEGFRSGIRFRTQAELQTDRALVETILRRMEDLARTLAPQSV